MNNKETFNELKNLLVNQADAIGLTEHSFVDLEENVIPKYKGTAIEFICIDEEDMETITFSVLNGYKYFAIEYIEKTDTLVVKDLNDGTLTEVTNGFVHYVSKMLKVLIKEEKRTNIDAILEIALVHSHVTEDFIIEVVNDAFEITDAHLVEPDEQDDIATYFVILACEDFKTDIYYLRDREGHLFITEVHTFEVK